MKINQTLLIAALSLFTASGLMAKQQAEEKVPGVAAQPASYFYTGKPYDADLGAFTFNYRNYDPEMKRWTTADPSGFPDGANNRLYTNTPTFAFDPNGLEEKWITGTFTITANWVEQYKLTATANAISLGLPYSVSINIQLDANWILNGATSYTRTSGVYPEQATAPSGWTWSSEPNTIICGREYTVANTSYGSSYQGVTGTTITTSYIGQNDPIPNGWILTGIILDGKLQATHTEDTYGTLRDGSKDVVYTWERKAIE